MKLSYKVKFQLQTDILEQAWSSYKLLLHVEIQSHLPKKYFSRSLFLHKNKDKIIFREALS